MASLSWPGPRRSVEALSAELGREVVVEACLDLLVGREVDNDIVYALGGPPARWAVEHRAPGPDYWLRVWALRGLLWLGDEGAAPALLVAFRDDSWRVREMAARVAARHVVDDALDALVALPADPNMRVRGCASRALRELARTTTGDAP